MGQLLTAAIDGGAHRYGTVEVPASLRGVARTYLALLRLDEGAAQEAAGLLQQASIEHRNLGHVLEQARMGVRPGDKDSFKAIVQSLRGLCDLDLSASEATKLARLWHERGASTASASGVGMTTSSVRNTAQPNPFVAMQPATPGFALGGVQPASSGYALGGRTHTAPVTSFQHPMPQPLPAVAAAAPVKCQVHMPGLTTAAPTNIVELDAHEFVRPEEIVFGPCIGSGGSGAVFRGTFRGAQVAVKRLQMSGNQNAEELWREIDSVRFLRHPRLVRFYGACLTPPNICVLTEFMEGGSMYDLLHVKRAQLASSLRRRLSLQIAEAIAFLHGHKPPVVHRDVKTMNILLDNQLDAKLCDFGLTMPMLPDKTHLDRRAGGESGSPRYMAPEFFEDSARLTEKIDVWAGGCVLIEVFGGPVPLHDCESIQQICARLCDTRRGPLIPPTFSQGLRSLLQRCLEFDVKRRCSANDVYGWLSQLPADM